MKFRKIILTIAIASFAINIYGQADSLENRVIYAWTLNKYDLSHELTEIDTSLTSFQNFNPILTNTLTANYLGNLGTASQSRIYYDRFNFNTGFLFSQPYGIYFHLPTNQMYYNTKKQFTLLKYSNGGPKNESEQLLKVLHTQNVNKNLNFGIDYDLLTSDGRFLNQQVRQNKITLFSSYNGDKYSIHSNFDLNRVKAQENGGIDSLQYIAADEYSNRRNIPVKLEDASSQVLNTSFYFAQEYRFGRTIEEMKVIENDVSESKHVQKNNTGINKKGINKHGKLKNDISEKRFSGIINDTISNVDKDTIQTVGIDTITKQETVRVRKFQVSGFSISHELFYNSDARKYKDDNLTESFYDNLNIFIDSTQTSDKVQQKQFGNKISLNYKFKDKFSTSFSFYNEQMKYIYNIVPDSSFINSDTIVKTDLEKNYNNSNVSAYIKAKLFNLILFSGYGEYYINGYKKENSKLTGKFAYLLYKNTEISLEGNYQNQHPDYFYENYSSNNFQWNNKYLRDVEEWDVGFAIRNKKYNLDAKIRYGQITNYLFLDEFANVAQNYGQINIWSGDISKWIKLGPINSITRFVYQETTNDSILSLPQYNIYQSLYFEHLSVFSSTGGRLLWQIGLDYHYSSIYSADKYMPVSGMFYRQYDLKQPEYHCLDIFFNFSIKRARLYFKYNYLNVILDKNYQFTSPYYPAPDPLFKFGLAWTFYD